jgi:hypothetical protein
MTESTDRNAEPNLHEPAAPSSGLVRWFFKPKQRRFMVPATGAWILALDWLLFASNTLSAWLATPIVMVVGFVLGSAGAYLIQRRGAKDATWTAVLKAVLAGIVVGLPMPVGGTLIGAWVLLSSGLGNAREEILNR